MLVIFTGPWWSICLHLDVPPLLRCRSWLMAGPMQGRACDGSFLRRRLCFVSRFRGFMDEGRFANLCIRLIWIMAGSNCHIGSDQAQPRQRAITKSLLSLFTLATHHRQVTIARC